MMRSLAVAVAVAGICLSGMAQEKNTFHAKHPPSDKSAKKTSVPVGKSSTVGTSAAANSKDLQNLEHQTARSSAPHASASKASRTATVKPLKENGNSPIRVGAGSTTVGSKIHASSNPYKGRLKQKHARQ